MQSVASLAELQEAIRAMPKIKVCGAGTKTALSNDANLSVAGLTGVLQYDASEFTFTAQAGTPLAEIVEMLSGHGQFLPFDPPLISAGATLGGTVAAGISGAGRYRYGGVRDFLLGVRMVTGEGRIVFGGGKVVKNAAGFDIPKLMVGSLGRLGVMAELTFKVFPRPASYVSLSVEASSTAEALRLLHRVALSQTEPACLDLLPPKTLLVRIGGLPDAISQRIDRLRALLASDVRIIQGDEEEQIWHAMREFTWLPPGHHLIKIPITPNQMEMIEEDLTQSSTHIPRRYSVGGNICWLAWPSSLETGSLIELAETLNRPALPILGTAIQQPFNSDSTNAFLQRLTSVFDPLSKLQ